MTCEYCCGQDIPGCENCKEEPKLDYICAEDLRARKVSDLTISELFDLIVRAVKECKKQDVEQSEAEYKRLTTKPIVVMDISTRDGKPVPKEW